MQKPLEEVQQQLLRCQILLCTVVAFVFCIKDRATLILLVLAALGAYAVAGSKKNSDRENHEHAAETTQTCHQKRQDALSAWKVGAVPGGTGATVEEIPDGISVSSMMEATQLSFAPSATPDAGLGVGSIEEDRQSMLETKADGIPASHVMEAAPPDSAPSTPPDAGSAVDSIAGDHQSIWETTVAGIFASRVMETTPAGFAPSALPDAGSGVNSMEEDHQSILEKMGERLIFLAPFTKHLMDPLRYDPNTNHLREKYSQAMRLRVLNEPVDPIHLQTPGFDIEPMPLCASNAQNLDALKAPAASNDGPVLNELLDSLEELMRPEVDPGKLIAEFPAYDQGVN